MPRAYTERPTHWNPVDSPLGEATPQEMARGRRLDRSSRGYFLGFARSSSSFFASSISLLSASWASFSLVSAA